MASSINLIAIKHYLFDPVSTRCAAEPGEGRNVPAVDDENRRVSSLDAPLMSDLNGQQESTFCLENRKAGE
jgi:hypothetical protein